MPERVLSDEVEMQVLVHIAKEWERGRENEDAKSCGEAQQQNQREFFAVRKCCWSVKFFHQDAATRSTRIETVKSRCRSCALAVKPIVALTKRDAVLTAFYS